MQFQAGQLSSVILRLEQEQFTGVATLRLDLHPAEPVSRNFAFWKGALTFVDSHLPSPPEFAEFIRQKLNITFIDSALKVLEGRIKNRESVRELVEFLNRFGLFKWETLESVLEKEIILNLEPLLTSSGTLTLDPETYFDLSYGPDGHGFAWEALQKQLIQRQQRWQSFLPITPNTVFSRCEGKGVLTEEMKTHLQTWVDGQRSLASIADQTHLDPLELAQVYSQLLKHNWLTFPGATTATAEATQNADAANRPVVLSVDDSPIVQVSIQRAISDRYEVLCAKSAVEALNLLNARKVELLLLDVTMPDIDGLELCRTIRNIGKFKDLPVIMLTAKDGFMDKVKGQFAGSTHYLTKPVDRERLLPVLEKYISTKEVFA